MAGIPVYFGRPFVDDDVLMHTWVGIEDYLMTLHETQAVPLGTEQRP